MNYKLFISALFILGIIIYYNIPDIYSLCNIINKFLNCFCERQSIFDTKDFNWSQNFRTNHELIRNEYLKYTENNITPTYKNINSEVSFIDKQSKWKALFLRAYGVDTNMCKYFPLTMKLINISPCTLAFFSVLEAGAKLDSHIGIYKGVIRYHLGLTVPNNWQNCFLIVDKKKLHWHEGSDLMFDDMYTHSVENNTNQSRVILFLDIKRKFDNIIVDGMNNLFLKFIKSNDVLTETINNVNKYVK